MADELELRHAVEDFGEGQVDAAAVEEHAQLPDDQRAAGLQQRPVLQKEEHEGVEYPQELRLVLRDAREDLKKNTQHGARAW